MIWPEGDVTIRRMLIKAPVIVLATLPPLFATVYRSQPPLWPVQPALDVRLAVSVKKFDVTDTQSLLVVTESGCARACAALSVDRAWRIRYHTHDRGSKA